MIINQKIYNQIDATTKTIKSEERMERNYESVVDKDYESFTKIIADHCCGYLVVACKTFRRIIQAKIISTLILIQVKIITIIILLNQVKIVNLDINYKIIMI